MVIYKDKKNIVVAGANGIKILDCASFRFFYTKKTPYKSWPDKPNPFKFYGANYCGGTKYAYCPARDEFFSCDNKPLCQEGTETAEMYFKGDGNISKTLNNYQIIEFDSLKDLIKWLDWS